jgi:hypothetical protein
VRLSEQTAIRLVPADSHILRTGLSRVQCLFGETMQIGHHGC